MDPKTFTSHSCLPFFFGLVFTQWYQIGVVAHMPRRSLQNGETCRDCHTATTTRKQWFFANIQDEMIQCTQWVSSVLFSYFFCPSLFLIWIDQIKYMNFIWCCDLGYWHQKKKHFFMFCWLFLWDFLWLFLYQICVFYSFANILEDTADRPIFRPQCRIAVHLL